MFALLALLAVQDRVPEPPDCSESTGVGYGVSYQPAVTRQGDTIELTGMVVRGYGMPPTPASPQCVSDWKVEGEGVKLLRGGKLQISDKAVPGTVIRFSAQIGGIRGERGYGSLKVIGATEKVLSGRFSVAEQSGCTTPRIAEMGFSANGYYNYTLPEDMFETKVTGSGAYRWDGDSGKLELGGSDEPFRAQRIGTAKWIGGALVLEGIDPGGTSVKCRITLTGG